MMYSDEVPRESDVREGLPCPEAAAEGVATPRRVTRSASRASVASSSRSSQPELTGEGKGGRGPRSVSAAGAAASTSSGRRGTPSIVSVRSYSPPPDSIGGDLSAPCSLASGGGSKRGVPGGAGEGPWLPKRSRKDPTPTVGEMALEVRALSIGELVQGFLDRVRAVETTALRSSNLKGTSVRDFKHAARYAEATLMEVIKRGGGPHDLHYDAPEAPSLSAGGSSSLLRENEGLRREMAELRETNTAIRMEMMAMKRAGVPPVLLPLSSSSPPRVKTPCPGMDVAVQPPLPEYGDVPPFPPSPTPMPPPSSLPHPVPTGAAKASQKGLLDQLSILLDAKLAPIRREQAALRAAVFGSAPASSAPGKAGGAPATERAPPSRSALPASSPVGESGGAETRKKRKKKKKKKKAGAAAPAALPSSMRKAGASAAAVPPVAGPPSRSTPATTAVPLATPTGEAWSAVVGRRAKRAAAKAATPPSPPKAPPKAAARGGKGGRNAPRVPAPPKTAAIGLSVPEGCKATLGEAMAMAKSAIKLADFGIAEIRPKRAITGGLLLEIPGPEGAARADALAARMVEVLAPLGVRVARPIKTADLRVRGLDDSVTPGEIRAAVVAATGCSPEAVKVGEVRSPTAGLGTAWLQCPAAAARKLAGDGKIRVGWSTARVEALAARPLQCFRCLALGHVGQRCTSAVDRSGQCFRCGSTSHRAKECSAAPRCAVCAELGRPAGHKAGSSGCSPPTKKGRRAGGKGSPSAPAVVGGGTAAPSPPADAVMEVESIPPPQPALEAGVRETAQA